ncbi:MAG: ribosome biogenesis GTPase YlqF [Spirochaetales bacterium]|nr:ribosome biogenesis GTPase YlqF [Spirochaetales bacterium]
MKQIQWFPGHMAKTKRLITEHLPKVDIVIEILDARIPQSSRNPLLEEITAGKPQLLVLNKSDLADKDLTSKWMTRFSNEGFFATSVNSTEPKTVSGILKLCRKIVEEEKGGKTGKINILIAGIPNVGKSTIINTLRKEKKASVQNKPGHTKDFQRIILSNELTLIDTPGILWHKFEPAIGYKLAILGSIKDSILDIYDIAFAAVKIFSAAYPERLIERFKLESLPLQTEETIELIGRNRGLLMKGGVVDFERACHIILREIRDGKLGPVSFESPALDDKRFGSHVFDGI